MEQSQEQIKVLEGSYFYSMLVPLHRDFTCILHPFCVAWENLSSPVIYWLVNNGCIETTRNARSPLPTSDFHSQPCYSKLHFVSASNLCQVHFLYRTNFNLQSIVRVAKISHAVFFICRVQILCKYSSDLEDSNKELVYTVGLCVCV